MSRTINNLHSKLGVAFTGVVEILVSTITSLSVCALAGFKITMIPWFVRFLFYRALCGLTRFQGVFPGLDHIRWDRKHVCPGMSHILAPPTI